MEYVVGAALALGVGVFASLAGLDQDRAFYPTVLTVIAGYYILFAVMGGGGRTLGVEAVGFIAFAAVAAIGFRFNLWIVAAALLAHGLFDFVHPHLVANAGAPAWWPMFCLSFDAAAAGYLAWLLIAARVSALNARRPPERVQGGSA